VTFIEAIILGIVQGITEFLPVSSSGHLKLAEHLLKLENLKSYILFDLVCHLGTLFSILIVFRQKIIESLKDQTKFFQIVLGTLPLFPLLLILKPIKAVFNDPHYLGYCFIITSILLYLGIKKEKAFSQIKLASASPYRDPLLIGMFQSAAILPGISRSGSTISAAKMLGWKSDDAISFSFLLAIPAIMGGVILESYALVKSQEPSYADVALSCYIVAFFTSFIFGYFSLSLLRRLATKQKFMYFVWYCLILGILTAFYI